MNTPAGMPKPNLDNKIASQSGAEVQSNGANGKPGAPDPGGATAPEFPLAPLLCTSVPD